MQRFCVAPGRGNSSLGYCRPLPTIARAKMQIKFARNARAGIEIEETFTPTISSSCVCLLSGFACELHLDECVPF